VRRPHPDGLVAAHKEARREAPGRQAIELASGTEDSSGGSVWWWMGQFGIVRIVPASWGVPGTLGSAPVPLRQRGPGLGPMWP